MPRGPTSRPKRASRVATSTAPIAPSAIIISRTRPEAVFRVSGMPYTLLRATIMPTSTASPPAMSATGIGLSATAAPLVSANVPDHPVGGVVSDSELVCNDLLVQVARREQGIESNEGLPFAFEDVEDPQLQGLDHGRGMFPLTIVVLPSGPWILTRNGSGRAAVMTTSSGRIRSADAFVLDLGIDRVAVGVGDSGRSG